MPPKNSEIKIFIDFFHDTAQKIRKEKPQFVPGKDGRLVQLALRKLTSRQLEQLAIWFLEKKRGLSTTIGAMLSNAVLQTLMDTMKGPHFWKELDAIYDTYFPRPDFSRILAQKFQPFTHKQIAEIQEEVASLERVNPVRSSRGA